MLCHLKTALLNRTELLLCPSPNIDGGDVVVAVNSDDVMVDADESTTAI
jgi:hypothetical protein